MEYESVKVKVSGVTEDKRCKYNKFKDEDRYTIGKHAAIHGTAAACRKFIIDSLKAQLGLCVKNIKFSFPHHHHYR